MRTHSIAFAFVVFVSLGLLSGCGKSSGDTADSPTIPQANSIGEISGMTEEAANGAFGKPINLKHLTGATSSDKIDDCVFVFGKETKLFGAMFKNGQFASFSYPRHDSTGFPKDGFAKGLSEVGLPSKDVKLVGKELKPSPDPKLKVTYELQDDGSTYRVTVAAVGVDIKLATASSAPAKEAPKPRSKGAPNKH